MSYLALCETAFRGTNGKPRTPYAIEYEWGVGEHHRMNYFGYSREEVFRKARLWAFDKLNNSVVWLEIYNSRNKQVYAKFARITKNEMKELVL